MAREDRSEGGGLMRRVVGDYREMPGLSITLSQGCRLWQLDKDTCVRILGQLVQQQFLRQTPKGLFIRV